MYVYVYIYHFAEFVELNDIEAAKTTFFAVLGIMVSLIIAALAVFIVRKYHLHLGSKCI